MAKNGAQTLCFRISYKKKKKTKNDDVPMFVQKLSFPSQNETCLVDFMVLELTLTSGQLFYRAIYLER